MRSDPMRSDTVKNADLSIAFLYTTGLSVVFLFACPHALRAESEQALGDSPTSYNPSTVKGAQKELNAIRQLVQLANNGRISQDEFHRRLLQIPAINKQ